jgi:hypothetical protein
VTLSTLITGHSNSKKTSNVAKKTKNKTIIEEEDDDEDYFDDEVEEEEENDEEDSKLGKVLGKRTSRSKNITDSMEESQESTSSTLTSPLGSLSTRSLTKSKGKYPHKTTRRTGLSEEELIAEGEDKELLTKASMKRRQLDLSIKSIMSEDSIAQDTLSKYVDLERERMVVEAERHRLQDLEAQRRLESDREFYKSMTAMVGTAMSALAVYLESKK